jgi:diguanylate cyclase (GGDEF)-like protein
MFLGRYGGDEFIIIAHPFEEKEIEALKQSIRENVVSRCRKEKKEYTLSVGIGYGRLMEKEDSFQKCIQRADEKLYLDKEKCKKEIGGD